MSLCFLVFSCHICFSEYGMLSWKSFPLSILKAFLRHLLASSCCRELLYHSDSSIFNAIQVFFFSLEAFRVFSLFQVLKWSNGVCLCVGPFPLGWILRRPFQSGNIYIGSKKVSWIIFFEDITPFIFSPFSRMAIIQMLEVLGRFFSFLIASVLISISVFFALPLGNFSHSSSNSSIDFFNFFYRIFNSQELFCVVFGFSKISCSTPSCFCFRDAKWYHHWSVDWTTSLGFRSYLLIM